MALSLATLAYRQRVVALPCTNDLEGLMTSSSQLFDIEGGGAVRFENYEKLSDVANKIEGQRHYQQDINCQYVMANYYMYQDIDKAERTLESIKTLQEDGQEISETFAGAGVDRLQYKILVHKTIMEENQQNTFHIRVDREGSE